MLNRIDRRWRYAVLAAYWLLLFAATTVPATWLGAPPGAISASDKTMHFLAYCALSFLLCWARSPGADLRRASLALGSLLIVCLYGAFDEWHQKFIPTRGTEWGDLLADVLGATVGCVFWLGRDALSAMSPAGDSEPTGT